MLTSYGKFVLPAALAAAMTLYAGSAAQAGRFHNFGHFVPIHAGHGHAGHMHHGRYGHPHHRHGFPHHLRLVRPMPILVEPGHAGTAMRSPGRRHHVPGGWQFASTGSYIVGGYEGYGLPTALPGGGTYVGGIAAVVDPGNGAYFAVDGAVDLTAPPPAARPVAKIIEVDPQAKNANCSMENGVCVIRP